MLLECGRGFPELLLHIFRLEPKLSELWPATEVYDIFKDAVFCCIFLDIKLVQRVQSLFHSSACVRANPNSWA